MLLVEAIRKNAKSLAEAQNDYKQNVILVNTLVTSVLASNLPTLNTDPPDYSSFAAAQEQAQSDALDWVNNVMARLLDVPDEVQGYNTIVSQLLQDASTQASALVSQPLNQQALEMLTQDLTNLSRELNLVVTFISGAVTNIQSFQDKLPDMATQLQAIATQSVQDANADQQQIDKLNTDIATLQADIKSLTDSIVALGIADGVALTLGVVATIAAWPAGALVWLVMGPVVAVTTTFIALDAKKIVADKDLINADQQQITGITADVSTLNTLAQSYSAMATQAQDLQSNLQAILTEWQTLESDINAAIADISTATADADSANFNAVLNDVNDAIAEWNAAYNQAGAIAPPPLQVSNAQLTIGMSSSDVQSALAASQTVGIIQYYNQLAA